MSNETEGQGAGGNEQSLLDDLTVLAQAGPPAGAAGSSDAAPGDGQGQIDESLINGLAALSTVHAGSPPPSQVGAPPTVSDTVEIVAPANDVQSNAATPAAGSEGGGTGAQPLPDNGAPKAEPSSGVNSSDRGRPAEQVVTDLARVELPAAAGAPPGPSGAVPVQADQQPEATIPLPELEATPAAAGATASPVFVDDAEPLLQQPVGNGVVLTVAPAHGREDVAVALDIRASLIDGADSMAAITISGVPAGASLSAGQVQPDGIWLLSQSDLAGLTIRLASDAFGRFDLQVSTSSSEAGNTSATATATVAVTVDPVNDLPQVGGVVALAAGSEDTLYVIRPADLLGGASDVDGDTLQVANLHSSSGAVSANPDGSWTLTPVADFNGPVTLSYDVVDGAGGSTPATASLVLAAVNDAPTTSALNLGSKQGDQTLVLTRAQLLANAADIDHDTLVVSDLTANGGTVTDNGDGTWSLTTPANIPADVALSYTVSDGRGGSVDGSASVSVIALAVQTVGTAGNDTLTGTLGIDIQDGAAGNDVLNGLGSDDTLIGGIGNDTIDGGAGNDLLTGGAGADRLTGGSGTDTASYNGSTLAVTVNLSLATAQVSTGDASGDVLSGIENVTGSGLNDILTGDAGANRLDGGAGNDTLAGGGGADSLIGGAGVDTASYAASVAAVTVDLATGQVGGGDAEGDALSGIESITGSNLNDILTGDAGANRLDGGAGDDRLSGAGGADSLVGGTGIDTASYAGSAAGVTVNLALATAQISAGDAAGDVLATIENVVGSGFADILTGNTGNNLLEGGAGADTLSGGAGTDTAVYAKSAAGVTVNLATGRGSGGEAEGDVLSTLENLTGSGFDDVLTGDALANGLSGGAGADTIDGAAGNDVIQGGAGADILTGGAGTDTLLYTASTAGVTVVLGQATPQSGGDAAGDVLSGFEYLTGSAFGDSLTGDAQVNVLIGGAGDDTLDGGAGNDQLTGGLGADTLIGGAGIDLANYSAAAAGVAVDLAAGTGSAGEAAGDVLSGIEYLLGGSYNDSLTGDNQANSIDGSVGNDIILGGGGGDILIGGTGNDIIDGGDGNDQINGGAGADTLIGGLGLDSASYAGSTGVTVDLSTGLGSGGFADGDLLSGIETLIGSSSADVLIGDGEANLLDGGVGADTLTGNAGDDVLRGGAGADQMSGGDGSDTASYSTATVAIAVDLGRATAQSGGDAAGDVLAGIENVIGGSAADVLTGDGGANILAGGAGNDTLEGGAGDDLLTGGAGADKLVGGAGLDTAAYAASTVAVTVNLGTGLGSGGDAASDVLSGIENITGSALNDILTGDVGVNLLDGGAGNDTLTGGAGADSLVGGAGSDTASYAASGAAVTVNLATGLFGGGDADGDVLSGIENITATSFNDTLTGDADANRLDGGGGDDLLVGGEGADSLIGGTGTDTASYQASAAGVTVNLALTTAQVSTGDASGDILATIEKLLGSGFADTLIGGTGVNVLDGGAGDDVLRGAAGADTLIGGSGNDSASYAGATAAVTVDLSTGLGTVGDAAGDLLSGIENLTGGNANDILTGDAGANLLDGGAGNDTLTGGAGADSLVGGAGVDSASYLASGAAVTVNLATNLGSGGDAEDDVLTGIENISGSTLNDTLTGDAAANRLDGGTGDDRLAGGAGADSLIGGTGTDIASYQDSAAGVTVNLALTTAQVSGGDASGDVLATIENVAGSAFADSLIGSTGANLLDGGAGDDVLRGAAGADILFGGAGTDTASYAGATVAVNVNLATGLGSGGDAAGDVLSQIENIAGGNAHDILSGDAAANRLEGGAGNDTLSGAGGDDLLRGGAGTDILAGGEGRDTADYSTATSAVTVDLNRTTGQTGGDAAGDILSNIENVTGGSGNDVLTGDGGANILIGGAGSDTLTSGGGDDILVFTSGDFGAAQAQPLADFVYGGGGVDTVDIAAVGQAFQLMILGVEQPLPAGSHEFVSLDGIQGDIRFEDNSVIHLDGVEKIVY